jgi:hypothetical protein
MSGLKKLCKLLVLHSRSTRTILGFLIRSDVKIVSCYIWKSGPLTNNSMQSKAEVWNTPVPQANCFHARKCEIIVYKFKKLKVKGIQGAVAFSLFPVFEHSCELNIYYLIYLHSLLVIKMTFLHSLILVFT